MDHRLIVLLPRGNQENTLILILRLALMKSPYSQLFIAFAYILLISHEDLRLSILIIRLNCFRSSKHCWIVVVPRGNEESICLSTFTNALLKPPGNRREH